MADWILMALIAAVVSLLTWVTTTAYCVTRFEDLRLEHQKRLGAINNEIIVMRDMVARTEMQRRVLGEVPVSRLIDRGEDDR